MLSKVKSRSSEIKKLDLKLLSPLDYPIFLWIRNFTTSPVAIELEQLIEMS